MTTDTKPTKKQIATLKFYLESREEGIKIMQIYHQKRVEFFKYWSLILNIVNALASVGFLTAIGWQLTARTDTVSIIKTSLSVAAVTILLLFLGMLFDLTRKEETHRWLVYSYINFEKTIININTENWKNLSRENYERHKKIIFDMDETINSLRKKKYLILVFLHFLCWTLQKQENGKPVPIVFHIKWWQFSLANYFSMPNSVIILFKKFNAKQRQEQKQKKSSKNQKDKKENPS